MKLGFNETENDENQVVKPPQYFARFDIFGFWIGVL